MKATFGHYSSKFCKVVVTWY